MQLALSAAAAAAVGAAQSGCHESWGHGNCTLFAAVALGTAEHPSSLLMRGCHCRLLQLATLVLSATGQVSGFSTGRRTGHVLIPSLLALLAQVMLAATTEQLPEKLISLKDRLAAANVSQLVVRHPALLRHQPDRLRELIVQVSGLGNAGSQCCVPAAVLCSD